MIAVIAGAAIAFVIVAAALILGALYLGWQLRGMFSKSALPLVAPMPAGPVKLRAVGGDDE